MSHPHFEWLSQDEVMNEIHRNENQEGGAWWVWKGVTFYLVLFIMSLMCIPGAVPFTNVPHSSSSTTTTTTTSSLSSRHETVYNITNNLHINSPPPLSYSSSPRNTIIGRYVDSPQPRTQLRHLNESSSHSSYDPMNVLTPYADPRYLGEALRDVREDAQLVLSPYSHSGSHAHSVSPFSPVWDFRLPASSSSTSHSPHLHPHSVRDLIQHPHKWTPEQHAQLKSMFLTYIHNITSSSSSSSHVRSKI